jgi:hypothetical protein
MCSGSDYGGGGHSVTHERRAAGVVFGEVVWGLPSLVRWRRTQQQRCAVWGFDVRTLFSAFTSAPSSTSARMQSTLPCAAA